MADRMQYSQWLKKSNNTFYPTDNSKTQNELDAGVYNINHDNQLGYYAVKKDLQLDELIDLPSQEAKDCIDSIYKFWERKDKFIEYGYAYKRGILLYGVPGGGKTSIINLLCNTLTKDMNGVVFTMSTNRDLENYTVFMPEIYRAIEKNRPIITIIEDLDGLCQTKETETTLLNVLDGIEQLQNVVYLATTNYMERLPERMKNRPNRFDRRIEVKSPNAECRKMYFEKKLKDSDKQVININEWVTRTEGMTMAHLGEVIKSVVLLGNGFEDTMDRLNGMSQNIVSRNYNGEFAQKIGFGNGKN